MEAKNRCYDKAIELQEESYRDYMEVWDDNWIAKGIECQKPDLGSIEKNHQDKEALVDLKTHLARRDPPKPSQTSIVSTAR